MICFLLWTTVNARLYSNTSMKSSSKVSFPCLSPFLIFSFYLNIYLVYLSTQSECFILYLGPRSTQDYSTISMKSSGKLFWSYLFSFPFVLFIHLSIFLLYLVTQSEYYILYSGPRSTQDYSTITIKSSGELFCPYLFPFSFFYLIIYLVYFNSERKLGALRKYYNFA